MCATGNGNLGADHIQHLGCAVGLLFCRGQQPRRPAGDQFVGQHRGVPLQPHAAVEVNLRVAGAHVCAHELLGVVHRLNRVDLLPAVRPKVITAEDDAVAIKSQPISDAEDEIAEVGGAHPGVSAKLVDLVGGRLDEDVGVVACRLAKSGLEHHRMRGAHREDADALAGLVLADGRTEVIGHGRLRGWVRMRLLHSARIFPTHVQKE